MSSAAMHLVRHCVEMVVSSASMFVPRRHGHHMADERTMAEVAA